MKKVKEVLSTINIRYVAIFLLLNVAVVVSLTSVFFLFGFKINSIMFIFESFVAGYITYLILRKEMNKKSLLNSMIFSISILFITILLGGLLFDYSWDGNIYHKQSIGLMKEGVNPVYNDSLGDQWVIHYPKAAETYAAVVYSFTNNIESGKAIHFILIISLLLLFYDYLVKKKCSKIQSFILAFVTSLSPLVVAQYSTYYIDGLVSLTLFISILAGITILDKDYKHSLSSKLIIYSASTIICTNLKFTALFISGMFTAILFIYYIIVNYKQRNFKINLVKSISFIFAMFLFSVCIVGASTYPKNYIEQGHPLYPLRGNGSVDIESNNEPLSFKGKNHFEKFLIATFAETDISYKDNVKLKIPFSISKNELTSLQFPDLRIGGFGIWFGGIVILSTIIIIGSLFVLYRHKNKFIFLVLGLLSGVILPIPLLPIVWQSRYYPHIYLYAIIPAALLVLYKNKNKYLTIATYVILILLVGNISFYKEPIKINYERAIETNKELLYLKEISRTNKLIISPTNIDFYGVVYNYEDRGIKYDYSKTPLKDGINMYYHHLYFVEDYIEVQK